MKALMATAALLALMAFVAGCRDGDAEPSSDANTPTLVAAQTASSMLKPADAQEPAAGICTDPPVDDVVTVTIDVDVPSPRCARITASQRVRIVNATDEPIRIQLGRFDVSVPPGEGRLLDAPAGTYLAPGVHVLSASIPSGRAALWLIDGSPP